MMGLIWSELWYFTVLFITFLTVLHILFYQDYQKAIAPSYPTNFIWFIMAVIAVFFALEPIILYSDKWLYENDFKRIVKSLPISSADVGFNFFVRAISVITHSATVFFLVTALVYLIGYYVFIRSKIVPRYRFIMFLTVLASMGFYAYGTNTIRAGLALSIFLMLLSRPYLLKLGALVLVFILLMIHKSLLLPVAALIATTIYPRKDNYLTLWIVCFVLSLTSGSTFVNLFGEYFSFADARVTQYTTTTIEHYQTGFRWDFVAFSIMPIVLSLYYKKKGYINPFYDQLLAMYIIANSVWLLLIRMPFSDRLATLSWFLIPVLIMYPLLTKRIFKKQHIWIAITLLVNASITLILNVLR